MGSKKKNKGTDLEIIPGTNTILPEKVEDIDDLALMSCECGNIHFRHAGYVESQVPYIDKRPGSSEIKTSTSSLQVKVCTSCKNCYVDYSGRMYNITNYIDLEAWDKTEVAMQRAVGPGGNC